MTGTRLVLAAVVLCWGCGGDEDTPTSATHVASAGDETVHMIVASTTVAPDEDSATVCVSLDKTADIVGAQNDLDWDRTCATLESCSVNPANGKELYTAPMGDSGLRTIFLSLHDIRSITDPQLYCCSFRVALDSGVCCPLQITATATSDPRGVPLETLGVGGEICRN